MKQKTIKNEIHLEGIGLHTNKRIEMKICPAPENSGIKFIYDNVKIDLDYKNVNSTTLATSIAKDGKCISTIEHFMSVIYVLGINNLIVHVNAPELPIMDGSALPFLETVLNTGIQDYRSDQRIIEIKEKITVQDGDSYITIIPSNELEIVSDIDFDHPLIKTQSFQACIDKSTFFSSIAPAKTFGFLKDIKMLKSNNLALGASLDNVLVLTDVGILNSEKLTYPDEFVRHKILDLIGDLSLLNRPLVGSIHAYKSGHKLNQELVKEILRIS